jgi:hypothetical protein
MVHRWLCLAMLPPVLVLAADRPAGTTSAPATRPTTTQSRPAFDPTSLYKVRDILGWKVLVHPDLLAQEELAKATLDEMEHQLYQVTRRVPPKAVEKLKKVPFWMELKDRDVLCACYHPSRQWLSQHGFNPGKAGSVEIGYARNFVSWTHDQPYMVLHELAHGYHHQVLGYDNPDIKAAFKKAVESKSYEKVLNFQGRTLRHYALNNDQEYFAEATEAFFGTNDFYPFVRPELRRHDPGMYDVLIKLWGVPERPTSRPATRPAATSSASRP